MRKLICAMLALALALTAFAAVEAPAASAEATELRFFDIASSTGRMEFFNKTFDEYYEKTGVRYTYDGAPWGTDSGIMTMLAAGNGPDVFVYQPHNEVYISNGWMLPIDEWVDAHRDEYVTLVADYFWVNERNTYGHNYAFPDATLSRGIYYRKDWVEEIGYEIPTGKDWTWAALWDLCEAINDPEKNRYGFDFRGGSGIDGWAKNYLSAYAGTYIYDPETLKWKKDEYREGMKTYTDCYINGWAPADSLNWAWAEQIDAFCSGLVGLFYNDSDCFPYMMERMEEGTWGVLQLPYSNDGLGVPTDINPTYSYAINAKTENPDACIGLIEFFNEPDRTVEY